MYSYMLENVSANKFTIEQVKTAHAKVKSGADFPQYVQEIIKLGVKSYETYVSDNHSVYTGDNGYQIQSGPKYPDLTIAEKSNKDLFVQQLKTHQQGGTDYILFCKQCAENGIEKWVVNMAQLICIYYDKAGNEILKETIPVP